MGKHLLIIVTLLIVGALALGFVFDSPFDNEIPMGRPGVGPNGTLLKQSQRVTRQSLKKWFPALFGHQRFIEQKYYVVESLHDELEQILDRARSRSGEKNLSRKERRLRDWGREWKTIGPVYQKMTAASWRLDEVCKAHRKRISKGKNAVWLALLIAIAACVVSVFGRELIGGILYTLACLWPLLHGLIWSPLLIEPLLVTAPLALPAAVFLASWIRTRARI